MQWNKLTDEKVLQEIITKSGEKPQVVFKHSSRCSISAVALQRMEKAQQPPEIDFYFLDLLSNRNLSNKVAEVFKVSHESPQVLVIKNGECTYDESHLGISMDEIASQARLQKV